MNTYMVKIGRDITEQGVQANSYNEAIQKVCKRNRYTLLRCSIIIPQGKIVNTQVYKRADDVCTDKVTRYYKPKKYYIEITEYKSKDIKWYFDIELDGIVVRNQGNIEYSTREKAMRGAEMCVRDKLIYEYSRPFYEFKINVSNSNRKSD